LSVEQIKKLPSDINGIKRTQNIQELVQLYSDADVLINPTYEDNFPTVNIEALACGTPVITYRTGGSPEAIDDNTGAVIEQGDINALSRKIIEFKNIEFKQCHAIDCRRRAEEHFDKDKCFEKYIAIYESLL
jgi:glycosyltransferase involved in cell wall biosynthesis